MATKKPTKHSGPLKPSDETWDTQRFKEQCFLASLWRPIVNFYRQQTFASCLPHKPQTPIYSDKNTVNEQKGFASPEFVTMIDCEVPQVTSNLLSSVKDVGNIVNIKNNLKALLVPRLRLYQLMPLDESQGGIGADSFYADKFKMFEFPFPGHIKLQDTMESRRKNKEKDSFGIESFSVKTTATDQAQVDAALVTCNLNLYFSSIHDLFEKRIFSAVDPLRYPDQKSTLASLITNTNKVEEVKRKSADKNAEVTEEKDQPGKDVEYARSFIIMASIGWQEVSKSEIKRADPLLNKKELDALHSAIQKCKQNVILYLVQYNFDIKEDGTVKLAIEYAGNIDSAYGSNRFDILGGELSEEKKQDLLDEDLANQDTQKAIRRMAIFAGRQALRISRRNIDCAKAAKSVAALSSYDLSKCAFRFHIPKGLQSAFSEEHSRVFGAYKELFNKPNRSNLAKGINLIQIFKKGKPKSEEDERNDDIFRDEFIEKGFSESQKALYSGGFTEKFHSFIQILHDNFGNLAAKEEISEDELIRRLEAKYRISQYRNIMENLYQEGKIHFIEMDRDLYESWKVWLRRDQLGGEHKTKVEATDEEPEGFKWEFSSYKTKKSYTNRLSKCKEELGCYNDKETGIIIYNIKKALEGNNPIVMNASPLSVRRINFVYFADIIDAAIKSIRGHIQDDEEALRGFVDSFKRKRIILGNVILQDRLLPDNQDKIDVSDGSYKKYSINVGDLPISMHSYINWFQKRASNLKLEEWSLKRFIMDCARTLLSDAFGYGCDRKINQRTNIRSAVIENYLDKEEGNVDDIPRYQQRIPLKPRVVITKQVLDIFKKAPNKDDALKKLNEQNEGIIGFLADPMKSKPRAEVKSDEVSTILYIYGESFERNNLKAIKSEDERMGIYHFNLGQDKGLVKSIKFQVDKDSILRTVRVVEATENDNNLTQIRDIYNANISMIGNPLFRPGMLVYIDPTLPGYSPTDPEAKSLVRNIGMGGYYMILNVSNNISNGVYKTDLTTVAVVTAADIRNDVSEISSENTKILFPKNIDEVRNNIPLYMYKDKLKVT